MNEFESLIEKYRRELIEFSKSFPQACPAEEHNEQEEKIYAAPQESFSETAEIEDCCEAEFSDKKSCKESDVCNIAGEDETEIPECEPESRETAALPQKPEEETTVVISEEKYHVPKFQSYEDFLKSNPQQGSLRVQVFAADRAFPVVSARVTVVLELENEIKEFFDGLTDINGIVDDIMLPAPANEMSQSPSDSPALPYSSYTTYIEHPDFVDAKYSDVPVFAGIKSIQGVELIPLVSAGNEPARIENEEGGAFSRLKGVESAG